MTVDMTNTTQENSADNKSSELEEYLGYLGDKEFVDIILNEFFGNIKNLVSEWRSGESAQDLTQLQIESEIKRLSSMFAGLNPDYKTVENWSGAPLAKWLKENAEIDFQAVEGEQLPDKIDETTSEPIIRAYIAALVSMYMGALAAEESGKLDKGRWQDWLQALKRKMRFQLLGIPG